MANAISENPVGVMQLYFHKEKYVPIYYCSLGVVCIEDVNITILVYMDGNLSTEVTEMPLTITIAIYEPCALQQCGILTSVDTEEPVQPPFKLRNSKWCSVSSLTLIEYSSN